MNRFVGYHKLMSMTITGRATDEAFKKLPAHQFALMF